MRLRAINLERESEDDTIRGPRETGSAGGPSGSVAGSVAL